jgi:hypothetical protein
MDYLNSGAKYVIALALIGGCFVLIYQGKGDQTQPWTVIGLIAGWIIRDSAGASAAANVATIAASQPTVTTSSGPPPSTTVAPSANGGTP